MSIAETAPLPVPTPCIDVCALDEAAGLCLGCARTADEIAAWQAADADFKRAVWAALPERRARLGTRAHRLPWLADECAGFMERALRSGEGRWRLGIHGAEAVFEGPAEIASDAEAVTAVFAHGALRLLKHEKTIAIMFGLCQKAPSPGRLTAPALSREGRGLSGVCGASEPDTAWCSPLPSRERADAGGGRVRGLFADHPHLAYSIGFVLPRGRVKLQKSASLQPIGPDHAAILPEHRHARLYDTGLGIGLAARICLRTSDPRIASRLEAAAGAQFPDHRELAADCGIVIETGLGRAELPAAAASTWLDLEALSTSRELPPGAELRPVFALGALLHPEPEH